MRQPAPEAEIRAGRHLIDAGYGPATLPSAGLLPANMVAAGIDPKAIDIVVLSHLHPDHINGIKAADGSLAFPNAEIKAPSVDWAFWMSDDNAGKAANDMMKGYFANTRKILSDIAGKMLVQSDVTNIPELFLRNPDWHVAFDVDPDKAVQTRRKFYDMAAAEKTLIAGFHFSFPSLGHVEKDGNGYRLVPIRWSSAL